MLESNLEKKKIRNTFIKAIACQLLPSLILAIAESAIVTDESQSIFEYLFYLTTIMQLPLLSSSTKNSLAIALP